MRAALWGCPVNGWKNHETWNVALWLQNDESLYLWTREIAPLSYRDLVRNLGYVGCHETPDGVAWASSEIDHASMNRLVAEICEVAR